MSQEIQKLELRKWILSYPEKKIAQTQKAKFFRIWKEEVTWKKVKSEDVGEAWEPRTIDVSVWDRVIAALFFVGT